MPSYDSFEFTVSDDFLNYEFEGIPGFSNTSDNNEWFHNLTLPDYKTEQLPPFSLENIGVMFYFVDGGKGEFHHIASDKSIVSGFTAQYDKIFKNAGMSLQENANLIFLENHSGAHTKVYKQYVLDYLETATKGLKGMDAKGTLTEALGQLKKQLTDNPKMPYKGGLE